MNLQVPGRSNCQIDLRAAEEPLKLRISVHHDAADLGCPVGLIRCSLYDPDIPFDLAAAAACGAVARFGTTQDQPLVLK